MDAKNNFNLEVVQPNINESESLFSVKNRKIVFGLAAIKGVGVFATDQIINERNTGGKFKNLTDFAKRAAPALNKRILENFIKAGALDVFGIDRAKLYYNADAILLYAQNAKSSAQSLSLFDNLVEDDVTSDRLAIQLGAGGNWGFNERLSFETEALGFSLSQSPLDPFKKLIKANKLLPCSDLENQGDKKSVRMAVNVISYNRRTTKTGKPMIVIKATDGLTNIDTVALSLKEYCANSRRSY
jgi:DNA polymerase-3 subunit alpha